IETKRAALAVVQAELAGARSTVRQTSREMERMRRLLEGGFVPQREFDQAELAVHTSASSLEANERRVSQAEREVQQAEAALVSRVSGVGQAKQRVIEARAALAR